MAENGRLQRAKLRPGIEPELVGQRLPGGLVHGERVGLAAGAVQRNHQLTTGALPQRVVGNERLQFGHQLGVASQREIRVEGDPAQLRQPDVRRGRDLDVAEISQHVAAPERQRLPEGGGRRRGIVRPRPTAGLDELAEAAGVGLIGPQGQKVARRSGQQQSRRLASGSLWLQQRA